MVLIYVHYVFESIRGAIIPPTTYFLPMDLTVHGPYNMLSPPFMALALDDYEQLQGGFVEFDVVIDRSNFHVAASDGKFRLTSSDFDSSPSVSHSLVYLALT